MNEDNSNKSTKSEGTPVSQALGKKRALENNAADNGKRAKDEISHASVNNPLEELHNTIPGIQYECIEVKGPVQSQTYTMQITIGDKVFKAEGTSKKKAKILVAQAALQYLSESNVNVKQVKDEVEPSLGNAVVALDDTLPGIQYECIGKEGPVSCPTYTMQVTIGDKVFKAEGASKKKAKELVAQAALKHLSETDVHKEAMLHSRIHMGPTSILNKLVPQGCTYELLEKMSDGGCDQHLVRMKVTVGGEGFEAMGRGKQLAKSYAAMYALQKLYNLKFTVPNDETIPIFDGDEQEWRQHMPVKELGLFEGRNPIKEMKNLYHPLHYSFIEVDTPNQEDVKFKCTLEVEDGVFNGTDSSRQKAKYRACLEALQYLKQQGLLEQKQAELAAAKKQRIEKVKVKDNKEEKGTK